MQPVPILGNDDRAEPVAGLSILFDERIAGERWRVAVGILRIVGDDRLIDAAEVDRPRVARIEAEGRAAAAHMDAVDVLLPAQRIVDIAAVGEHVADEAQRVAIVPDRQVGDGGDVAARIAMLGDRGARDRLQLHGAWIRRLRHDADDAAERPRAIEGALRPLEHLHRVNVVQAQVGIGRVVAETDVAQILPHGRLRRPREARIGDAADEQLVAPRAKVGRGHRRYAREDRIHPALAPERQIAAIEDRGDARETRIGGVGLARRDDDLVLGPGDEMIGHLRPRRRRCARWRG